MKPHDHNTPSGDNRERTGKVDFPSNVNGGAQEGVGAQNALAVQAVLTQQVFGWQIDVKPMRAFDALRIWSKLGADPEAVSLLFDVSIDHDGNRLQDKSLAGQTRNVAKRMEERFSLGTIADRLSIRSVDRFDDDQLVLDAMPLRELVGMIEQAHLRCVLVEGPIEPRDARDMRNAVAAGLSPLQVELRAAAALEVLSDMAVCVQTRDRKQAIRLVAESIRLYVSALRKRPIDEVAAPEVWQVERLLDVSGTISIRQVETDIFATFLDVGISTAVEPFTKPAEVSLIYDVPSNTWHDEK